MDYALELELETILFEVMCEEERPSYEALCRWIARCPRFREELVEFFVTWSLSEALSWSVLPAADFGEEQGCD